MRIKILNLRRSDKHHILRFDVHIEDPLTAMAPMTLRHLLVMRGRIWSPAVRGESILVLSRPLAEDIVRGVLNEVPKVAPETVLDNYENLVVHLIQG